MTQASDFFQEQSPVNRTLRRIAKKLEEIGVPYALVGGMALFYHGLRRFTEDVDLLVDAEHLQVIHEKLEGLGYLAPFAGSKNLRDTDTGVKIEFLITGQFPGDGKPKPVAFPDPTTVRTEIDGLQCIRLESLIELKLASGLSSPDRMKDISDVYELIKRRALPRELGDSLNDYVRAKYLELWQTAQQYAADE